MSFNMSYQIYTGYILYNYTCCLCYVLLCFRFSFSRFSRFRCFLRVSESLLQRSHGVHAFADHRTDRHRPRVVVAPEKRGKIRKHRVNMFLNYIYCKLWFLHDVPLGRRRKNKRRRGRRKRRRWKDDTRKREGRKTVRQKTFVKNPRQRRKMCKTRVKTWEREVLPTFQKAGCGRGRCKGLEIWKMLWYDKHDKHYLCIIYIYILYWYFICLH